MKAIHDYFYAVRSKMILASEVVHYPWRKSYIIPARNVFSFILFPNLGP